jgi:hypothetical protein
MMLSNSQFPSYNDGVGIILKRKVSAFTLSYYDILFIVLETFMFWRSLPNSSNKFIYIIKFTYQIHFYVMYGSMTLTCSICIILLTKNNHTHESLACVQDRSADTADNMRTLYALHSLCAAQLLLSGNRQTM